MAWSGGVLGVGGGDVVATAMPPLKLPARSLFRRNLTSSRAWDRPMVPVSQPGATWNLIHFAALPLGATLEERNGNALRMHLAFGSLLEGKEPFLGRVIEHDAHIT
jgi:hypothetical protein